MKHAKFFVLGAATVLVADIAGGMAFVNGLGPTGAKVAKYAIGGAFVAVAHHFLGVAG